MSTASPRTSSMSRPSRSGTRRTSSARLAGSSRTISSTSGRSPDRPLVRAPGAAFRQTHTGRARDLEDRSMGMGNLQRMAQQMQQEMLRIEGELRDAHVDGSAGGGVVKAVVTGKQELVSIAI